tara:strand:- start:829 stop:1047 length:219 start_codon:yes stop_codon:yes gene_type:complete
MKSDSKSAVTAFCNNLIKDHRGKGGIEKDLIGYEYPKDMAIHASIVTCKMLIQVTGKKFYYKAVDYLNELNE